MRFALFYHSFCSCWNHGNAHFLRGVSRELIRLGHQVTVYETEEGWSRQNALADGGAAALAEASTLVPDIELQFYRLNAIDLERALADVDVAIAHEWNAPALIAALSRQRILGGRFVLLFHDTHHRAISAPHEIDAFDLSGFDGVLAFGEVLREVYVARGWGRRAFTWHEGADTELFRPLPGIARDTDLIWIGNWGDGERAQELQDFLLEPVSRLGINARLHGVRYPREVTMELAARAISYAGWLPNHRVPHAFARARATVHVPRRPYVEALRGIPTIRMFEALACGIPLISAPWGDVEGLFPAGSYVATANAGEMAAAISLVLRDSELAKELAGNGIKAVRARHSCAHRVAQLLAILEVLGAGAASRSRQSLVAQQRVAVS
jgi:spore maturation protein CgeB